MTEDEPDAERALATAPPDRMVMIGLAASVLVLAGAGACLWLRPQVEPTLVAGGTIALLGVLWLALAWLRQSRELGLQREELALQRRQLHLQQQATRQLAEAAQVQVEVLRETRTLARRESFVRLLDLYERRLVVEASHLSSLTAIDRESTDRHQAAWRDYERGDRNALFRSLASQLLEGRHVEFLRRIDQTSTGRALLERFSGTVAEVMEEASGVDPRLASLCRSSEWAFLAELLESARAAVPPERRPQG
ncbi:MAG: hypothetical protein U1E23_17940 [Reyranellaceae bacterium]